MDDMLSEQFDRLLMGLGPIEQTDAMDAGPQSAAWRAIAESGFLDAVTAEEHGGAGVSFSEIFPLAVTLGRRLTPAPVIETMIARAILAQAGHEPPEGSIALGDTGEAAAWRLRDLGGRLALEPAAGGASIEFAWNGAPLRNLAAATLAARMAGAVEVVLTMTIDYAFMRKQFGREIGKFQAVQQQLAVMAEEVAAASAAARLAFVDDFTALPSGLAAAAKLRTGEAALLVATTAHALHGAIGISKEHTLQLFTRRLHRWRLAGGSGPYWGLLIGRERLAYTGGSVDFVRTLADVR
ncbi:MAG: acyl-CoA dehydrogenase family protein [Phenylobacterium sp.]|uniref:acyl-CoA dehydrogenase family protein n=1 Tax=Phenylobacterium sp. TaxID=1871053 RepID=UPI0027376084|nr:acyl-CoA dehydrogenase family protein [Phenylobacterium sp.]MDP3173822.1 acyl-CoA dehydrogenase family protein [Phenylobacterium sp.]